VGNPPPGTIVDTDCVHPSWYDFYVVSQSVKQGFFSVFHCFYGKGTASPTHYHVVYDTTELQQEHMQKLTYKLTHLYYNW
jgi:aubergine-like protein